MEVFIDNIPSNVTENQVKAAIAKVIHKPAYRVHSSALLNLHVVILPSPRRNGTHCGIVTFTSAAVANQFLNTHGPNEAHHIYVGLRLQFKPSIKHPRPDIVEQIRRTPYIDPNALMKQERKTEEILSRRVEFLHIQFGWECRDKVFSVEWELFRDGAVLGDISYHDVRREFRVYLDGFDRTHIAVIRAAQIVWVGSATDGTEKACFMSLSYPPAFETDVSRSMSSGLGDLSEAIAQLSLTKSKSSNAALKRHRHSHLHPSQLATAPYTSLAIRIIFNAPKDLRMFNSLCREAHMTPSSWVYPTTVHRGLFNERVQMRYAEWLLTLSWKIAFQLETLVRGLLADPKELLACRTLIRRVLADKGEPHLIALLRYFAVQLKNYGMQDAEAEEEERGGGEEESEGSMDGVPTESLEEIFSQCANNFVLPLKQPLRPSAWDSDNIFECLHAKVTPTRVRLEGPYPERSNRVMRSYPHNHDSFIRVTFLEENNLQIRVDHDVDGLEFIKKRYGEILHNGLEIGGRRFYFLAYSQSALKEHAVWFVKDFITPDGREVTAASIIASLGDFTKPDPRLIHCPARYAARISQAFTATDASASVQAEEILIEDDILDDSGIYNFTDGIGTISRDMTMAIWKELRRRRKKIKRNAPYPRAFQIRFQGSKGMLSVDYTLRGKVIVLRPSMIKFQAPDANIIEIARSFEQPGPLYLNRPLIMILEQLGVPYESFKALQDRAVKEAQNSIESLSRSARLLETYGLGASFKVTSVMLSLEKLGLRVLPDDVFYTRMMDFAVNHVLRELKHHARIPVKDAWNVVGVADIHGYLNEGEVFIHIVPPDGKPSFYFEGRTLVFRSPTIHPGDVQIVRAIGRPPPGSPFERETLRNCVVFSTRGSRPLPSYLGGGDLDGDVYCVTMLRELMPKKTYEPAAYTPAEWHTLNRPSTMADVADFVTEYIYSDSLGLIATQWLTIADQASILDPDCLRLSQLHSDAVDYPKTGRPVQLRTIPRLKWAIKPDWSAPETSASLDKSKYYESQRAIGRLFRAIDLPAVHSAHDAQHDLPKRIQLSQAAELDEVVAAFHAAEPFEPDELTFTVYERVTGFIAVGRHDDNLVGELWDIFQQYMYQIKLICADHTLSTAHKAMLTEEEVVVGTIVAKCSQRRKRKEMMSKMRERTAALAQEVGSQIEGDEGILPEMSLERAWIALRISNLEQDAFAAKSFGWIALGEIFDAIKRIEESEGYL